MESSARPRKILYSITKSYFGGAQRYVFDLATHFADAGDSVEVMVGGDGVLTEKLNAAKIPTITLPYLERDVNPLSDMRTLFAFMQEILRMRPDVLHVNSAKAGGLGAVAGRLLFVPRVIFTAHGFAFNEDRGFLSKLLIKTFTWITIALAHETIAVSEALRLQVPHALRRKVRVVRNAVRPIAFVPRDSARAFLSEKCPGLPVTDSPDTFWIATIAELHPIKGLGYALEAMALLKKEGHDFRYVIMGGGEKREELQKQIEALGLSENVFLAGFVEDAPTYLSAFDAFLLPSLSEGLAYVLLEAGFAGLPIIATNVGGIPEIIRSGENGLLVPSKNSVVLGGALTRVITDKSLRTLLGNEIEVTVGSDFGAERLFAETDAAYLNRLPS